MATYALWTPAPFDLDAAFTSLSGIDKNGNSGTLNGNDACGAATRHPGCGGARSAPIPVRPVRSTATRTTRRSSSAPRASAGRPRTRWASTGPASRRAALLPPDYVYPRPWPTAAQFLNWPVVKVNGNLTMPGER